MCYYCVPTCQEQQEQQTGQCSFDFLLAEKNQARVVVELGFVGSLVLFFWEFAKRLKKWVACLHRLYLYSWCVHIQLWMWLFFVEKTSWFTENRNSPCHQGSSLHNLFQSNGCFRGIFEPLGAPAFLQLHQTCKEYRKESWYPPGK